jgi:hypothetical protein
VGVCMGGECGRVWLCMCVARGCVCIGNMGVWSCGGVVVWLCGCVLRVVVCGCVCVAGLCDYVVCWSRGCVVV